MQNTLCILDIIKLANACGSKVKNLSINFDIRPLLCYTLAILKEDGVVVNDRKERYSRIKRYH